MYTIRWEQRGKIYYAKTEDYETAITVAEALTKHGIENVQVWDGQTFKRQW